MVGWFEHLPPRQKNGRLFYEISKILSIYQLLKRLISSKSLHIKSKSFEYHGEDLIR